MDVLLWILLHPEVAWEWLKATFFSLDYLFAWLALPVIIGGFYAVLMTLSWLYCTAERLCQRLTR